MIKKIFVDGSSGTTGLEINERLSRYDNIEVMKIDYDKRRDIGERRKILNEADLVFLCLPDDAAKESVALVTNPDTKIIDASTAHRTASGWTYGLSELSPAHKEAIISSKRVSNPGCHATAFALSLYPLIHHKVMAADYPVSCQSITGYSGGGKSLIEKYEMSVENNPYTKAPRPYSLGLNHKHLNEMMMHSGLSQAPVFLPIVADYYKGLATIIPIHTRLLNKKLEGRELHGLLKEHYKNQHFVKLIPYIDELALKDSMVNSIIPSEGSIFDGGLDITACNNSNMANIFVIGNDEKGIATIITRLDNLGKGASGAAIQNMNLMLGYDEKLNL
ncbi:MAG: N-acetyl-gamma-glutamyl-phosphate reductase [Clostridiales bacterium]|jgi:N-acetyl-gamma-glutamyl-phosphate reductase|nr:N-acetyl-gamma-glutamyl-phosphate reductase [Clostridiales bacterium]